MLPASAAACLRAAVRGRRLRPLLVLRARRRDEGAEEMARPAERRASPDRHPAAGLGPGGGGQAGGIAAAPPLEVASGQGGLRLLAGPHRWSARLGPGPPRRLETQSFLSFKALVPRGK